MQIVCACVASLVFNISFKQELNLSNEFLSHRQLNLCITETKLTQKPRADIIL